jgi:(2Fe-2S) ferredoxin
MTTWDLNGTQRVVLLCNGDSCHDRDADAVTVALRRALKTRHLDPLVHTARTRCLGRCEDGCTVVVMPDMVWYRQVDPDVAMRIVAEHLVEGQPVADHVSFLAGPEGLTQVSGTRPGQAKPR